MSAADESLLKAIRHYQEFLHKYTEVQNDFKGLQYIEKLRKLPIQVYHLEQTGVGRTVNRLRKFGGLVSDAAKSLVAKWKEMVAEKHENEEDDDDDVDECYSKDLLGLPKLPDNKIDQGVGDSKSNDTDQDSPIPVPQESKSKERPSHKHSDNDRTVDRGKTPKNDTLKTENDQKDTVKSKKLQNHKPNGDTSSSSKHTSHSKRKPNSDASDSVEESKPKKRLKKNECSEDDVNMKRHEHKKIKESEKKHKEKDVKLKEESKISSSNTDEKKSFKSKSEPIHGIDLDSGLSFAEALGMCESSSSKSSPQKEYSVPGKLTKEKTATRSEDPIPKLLMDPSARLSLLARAAERSSHHARVKPKKAPLMAKSLSLLKLKNRFFRR